MAKSLGLTEKVGRRSWLAYLAVSFFSVLVFIVVISHNYFSTSRSLTESAMQRREVLSRMTAESVEYRLDHLIALGKFIISDLRFRQFISGGEWQEAMSIHKQDLATLPFVDHIQLADPSGVLMADLPEDPAALKKSLAYRDWYQGVSRKWEPYVSGVYRATGNPVRNVVAVAIPIWAKDKRVVGILVLQIRLDAFREWSQGLDVGSHAFIYIVDQRGNVVIHPEASSQGNILNFSAVPVVQSVLRGESGIIRSKDAIDRSERVSGFHPVKGYGWGAIVEEPAQSVFEARENAKRQLRFFYGLFLFLAALNGLFVFLFIKSRREREKELQESEALYRRWLNESTDGIWDWNLVTDEEYLSPHFKELFGYADDELPNHASSWQKIIYPDDLKQVQSAFKEHTESGKPFNLPVRYCHKNGSIVWVLCRGVAFKDKDGNYVRMLGTHTDISELIHTKEMSRLKDEFIDTVSHELRTPLTVIKEGVSLFQDQVIGSLDVEQRSFLASVQDNITVLSRLIDTMLDLSKIEAGKLQLKKERVDLAALIQKSLADHQPLLGRRTVEVQLASLPTVFVDPARVMQVLSNLLSNAIKFTQNTGTLRIALDPREGFAAISIQDDGVGIAPEDIPKLFKKFSQVGKSGSIGTGLGLALCKQLVEMHGGGISVVSAPRKGATFTFTLPIK